MTRIVAREAFIWMLRAFLADIWANGDATQTLLNKRNVGPDQILPRTTGPGDKQMSLRRTEGGGAHGEIQLDGVWVLWASKTGPLG